MPFFGRTQEDIVSEIVSDLVNNTALTTAAPGTKARALTEAVAKRLATAYRQFDETILLSFIRHAEGKFLDWLGELLSLERRQPTRASVSAGQLVVKFYVETGTFGSINGGLDITLPAGVNISASPTTTGIAEYRLPVSVVLNRTRSEQYVPVESLASGSAASVGRYQLKYHDFNGIDNYTDLKVINTSSIDNGSDTETDASYRYRLSQQVVAAEAANSTSIRMAALAVPGVADVVLYPYAQGAGTFEVLLKSTTPTVSQSLIDAVQAAIEEKKGVGLYVIAKAPDTISLKFVISLKSRRTITSSEQTAITRDVRQSLKEYVNSLDIGESFSLAEAIQRVMEVSDEIQTMGITPGRPIDEMYYDEKADPDDPSFSKVDPPRDLSPIDATTSFGRIIIYPDDINAITISWI